MRPLQTALHKVLISLGKLRFSAARQLAKMSRSHHAVTTASFSVAGVHSERRVFARLKLVLSRLFRTPKDQAPIGRDALKAEVDGARNAAEAVVRRRDSMIADARARYTAAMAAEGVAVSAAVAAALVSDALPPFLGSEIAAAAAGLRQAESVAEALAPQIADLQERHAQAAAALNAHDRQRLIDAAVDAAATGEARRMEAIWLGAKAQGILARFRLSGDAAAAGEIERRCAANPAERATAASALRAEVERWRLHAASLIEGAAPCGK